MWVVCWWWQIIKYSINLLPKTFSKNDCNPVAKQITNEMSYRVQQNKQWNCFTTWMRGINKNINIWLVSNNSNITISNEHSKYPIQPYFVFSWLIIVYWIIWIINKCLVQFNHWGLRAFCNKIKHWVPIPNEWLGSYSFCDNL